MSSVKVDTAGLEVLVGFEKLPETCRLRLPCLLLRPLAAGPTPEVLEKLSVAEAHHLSAPSGRTGGRGLSSGESLNATPVHSLGT